MLTSSKKFVGDEIMKGCGSYSDLLYSMCVRTYMWNGNNMLLHIYRDIITKEARYNTYLSGQRYVIGRGMVEIEGVFTHCILEGCLESISVLSWVELYL